MPNMVEILLATYNGEKYLKTQLDSLLNQTYKDILITIRDDGSTDNTLAIINEYTVKHKGKINFIETVERNLGSTQSFSYLINIATGPYIMLCDQDDFWLEDKVELTLNMMFELEAENPDTPVMVFTDLAEVDDELNIINPSNIKAQKLTTDIRNNAVKVLALSLASGCTIMLNRLAQKFVNPIPKYVVHDHWILINIAHYGKVGFVNKATMLYRQHNSNTIGANRTNATFFFSRIFNPIRQYKLYKSLITGLNFRVNVLAFLYYKSLFTIKRFIK